jgi:2-C-methyl-D-erythritol 4-phosphate cytidylyltransferase
MTRAGGGAAATGPALTSVVIVAAGRGTRMGPDVDKLFLEVCGLPLVAHTWRAFDRVEEIGEIVLVVRTGLELSFAEMAGKLQVRKPWRCVPGGRERQDSVWNGLEALSREADLVAIQDGARPCTSVRSIRRVLEAGWEVGAAVLGQPVTDTLKEADDARRVVRTVDRSRLWSVQTPQVFRVEVIRRALVAARESGLTLTDDTAACERVGQSVVLVESVEPNPKVTVPADLGYVEWVMQGQKSLSGG